MKYLFIFLVLLILMSGIPTSAESYSNSDIFKAKLQEKIDNFQAKKMIECRQNAIRNAEVYVDSLLAAEFSTMLLDSLHHPSRPVKPLLDSIDVFPDDTGTIKPLFEKKNN